MSTGRQKQSELDEKLERAALLLARIQDAAAELQQITHRGQLQRMRVAVDQLAGACNRAANKLDSIPLQLSRRQLNLEP